MSKQNIIKVNTHPNSRNKFEFGGWAVAGYPAAISISNKGKCYNLDFDKVPTFSVYEDWEGELGNLLLEIKLDEKNINISEDKEKLVPCVGLNCNDVLYALKKYVETSKSKNITVQFFSDESGRIVDLGEDYYGNNTLFIFNSFKEAIKFLKINSDSDENS